MKKFLGVFDIKKMTPEQIYEKAMKTLQEKDRLELIEMARKRGIQKGKKHKIT